MKQKEEMNYIIDVTCKVFNINKKELLTKNRQMHLSIPRIVAAVIGIKDSNIRKEIVAKCLNRDRSGMYYYTGKHKDYFDFHAPYRNGYVKVLKAYKDIDVNKKKFMSELEFNLFIKNIKFKHSKNPDIIILITCGKYKHNFLSDCFKFTEDISIIKNAFKGYKININYNTYEG